MKAGTNGGKRDGWVDGAAESEFDEYLEITRKKMKKKLPLQCIINEMEGERNEKKGERESIFALNE